MPIIMIVELKPMTAPKLALPKCSLSSVILEMTLKPHPRLNVRMNGITNHRLVELTALKANNPSVIRTKLAEYTIRFPTRLLNSPLLSRPAMLERGNSRATRLAVDLPIPTLPR